MELIKKPVPDWHDGKETTVKPSEIPTESIKKPVNGVVYYTENMVEPVLGEKVRNSPLFRCPRMRETYFWIYSINKKTNIRSIIAATSSFKMSAQILGLR